MTVDVVTTPITFAAAVDELIGWSSQDLHVEVSVAGGAGVCSFDARFEGIASDGDEGSVLLRFQTGGAVVALSDVMSAVKVLSPTMEVSQLRFTVGDHQIVEIERREPAEIFRRVEGGGPDV
jgi:hypothetical protein